MFGIDKKWFFSVSIIMAIGFAIYSPAIYFDYVWDDLIWLDNLKAHQGNIFSLAFMEPFLLGNFYWRPIGELTLYIQPGENPEYFQHALNVVLHTINIGLMGLLGYTAWTRGRMIYSPWIYFLLLAIFTFHPAFVEPVAWVSGRFDLLLTTFMLSALVFSIKIDGGAKRAAMVTLMYFLALLTKETGIVFIPILVLFLWICSDRQSISDVIKAEKQLLSIMIFLTLVYLLLRAMVLGGTGGDLVFNSRTDFISLAKGYKVLSTIGAYLAVGAFPFKELDTLYPTHQMLSDPIYFVVGLLFVAITLFLLARTGLYRKFGLLCFLFLFSLVLVLNIIPTGFANNLIQNRYLYPTLALVLVFLAVDTRLPLSAIGKKALIVFSVAWLIVAVLNVNVTVPLWKSRESLSNWMVLENPESYYAVNMKGTQLLNDRYVEAAIDLVGPVAVNAPNYGSYKILGDAHYILGQCTDALVYYDYAYRLGEFDVNKVEGLLGQYQILRHKDPAKAEELVESARQLFEGNDDKLALLQERIDRNKREELDCRDDYLKNETGSN